MTGLEKKKELAKNTLIIMIGKLCTQFLSFFLLPLYTALLDKSEFGIVDLIITYVGLLVPCITLQLENAAFRFLVDVRSDDAQKRQIISNVLKSTLILSAAAIILYELLCIFLQIPYKQYLVFVVAATILSNMTLQIARGLGDTMAYSIGCLIAGGCTILFNVLFLVVFSMGPIGMLLSLILSNALCGLFVIFRVKLFHYIDFGCTDRENTRKLLHYSIPLVPNSVMWWIINASDRTIITAFLGMAANGIYAVAHKFPNAVSSLYYVFNTSWTESAALHLKDGSADNFITDAFCDMFRLFTCISLMVIGCMSVVFPIMVNASYAEAYRYIPVLMIGSVFNTFVGLIGAIYVALQKTKEIAVTSFWAGMINIVVSFLLVKSIGLFAAAVSTAVAFGVMSVYRYIDVQKYVKLRLKTKDVLLFIVAYAVSIFLYYRNTPIGNILNIAFVILVSAALNYKWIVSIVGKVIHKLS